MHQSNHMILITFSGGTYIALFVVILIDFVGAEKLSSGSGLAIMCLGLFNMPIPSVYGKNFFCLLNSYISGIYLFFKCQ